ncbi:MAG: sigma-E factor negative regulatory protein [Gammaproteobacteria bacterium]|nr:sigma-E factor negative regulatory protein [Gammaproteobacteria bacterium]MDH3846888.1 sigma-E factor negative regulatory protein [Gammaproteobacteria bacterium]
MNEAIRMQVSAFVDGELPDNEADLLVRRLSQDADLRQQVSEYLAIGRVMRGEYTVQGGNALRERVAAELEERPLQEPADTVVAKQPSRYVRPVAGAAIAATVALAAIFGLGQVADVDNAMPETAIVADETVSETVPTMNDDDLHQYVILHGYDSNSFSTRVTSLQIRADELSGEAAAEDPEAEDEVEVTEPVTSQP